MPKNIILCSDGTGNSAIKGRGTNVFKLFEAVDLTGHTRNPCLDPQLAFYDDGVGTEGNTAWRALGGAAGLGLGRNVRQLYTELSRVYDKDDRIYLFGFSRGAFTVRTLAGLIGRCGVIQAEHPRINTTRRLDEAIDEAYRVYRLGYRSHLARAYSAVLRKPEPDAAVEAFRQEWPVRPARIRFLGVWDTVDAVGMPFALGAAINEWIIRYKFPTQTLGKHVDHACHALALDDPRKAFEPVLWQCVADDDRIEQVWFAGAHSNVGGGYPKQGMSLVALEWMLAKARAAGLRLQELDLELFRSHASADDMLYNPRAGAGAFYSWAPRDVAAYCARSNIAPSIHVSVAERIAHGTDDYAPGNIPGNVTVAFTPSDEPAGDALTRRRAEGVEAVIRDAHGRRGNLHLLADVKTAIRCGTVSYWCFTLFWLVLLIGVAALSTRAFPADLPLLGAAVLGLGASQLARFAERTMSDAFSQFWHEHRPALRAALKRANAEARAALRNEAPRLGRVDMYKDASAADDLPLV